MPPKPILIAGAGLSALLLAQSLLRAKIPFQLFERDPGVDARGQGYRLRLSTEGLNAIESVLGGPDSEAWQAFWAVCSKTGGAGFAAVDAVSGRNLDTKGMLGERLTGREGKIISVARGDMRAVFMKGCEEFIAWDSKVVGYELSGDGSGVKAVFSDGTRSVEGEMLVGSEGVHSLVAKQLTGGQLKVYDTGARGIHGAAPAAAFRELGEGMFRISDEAAKVFVITNVPPEAEEESDAQVWWTM